jgi:hypothetical protein
MDINKRTLFGIIASIVVIQSILLLISVFRFNAVPLQYVLIPTLGAIGFVIGFTPLMLVHLLDRCYPEKPLTENNEGEDRLIHDMERQLLVLLRHPCTSQKDLYKTIEEVVKAWRLVKEELL